MGSSEEEAKALGDRIREARGAMTRHALGQIAGVSAKTIGAWERGEQVPNAVAVRQIAQELKADLNWLLTGESGEEPKKNRIAELFLKDQQRQNEKTVSSLATVRRIKTPLSAGSGHLLDYLNLSEDVYFSKDWLDKNISTQNPRKLAVITVRGDSMWPTVQDGQDVMIDMNDKQVMDGCIYAIRRGDTLLVKRLQKLANRLTLISDNQVYDNETLSADEANELDIIGRVRLIFSSI